MRTDLDHLPAHKQRERDISPNYEKKCCKINRWRASNLVQSGRCRGLSDPRIPQKSGVWKANWGRMMAIWSPNSLRPGIGPVLMAIWRVRSCRLRLGNMRSGIPSLPGLV